MSLTAVAISLTLVIWYSPLQLNMGRLPGALCAAKPVLNLRNQGLARIPWEQGRLVSCQLCGDLCHCPWPPPQCPAGVPLVHDGCRCCQICARQEGESCTDKNICDSQRGLQCDYSASYPGGEGECVDRNTLGCELNGVRYEEGQTFKPSCAQLCHCLGGGITCVPLCKDMQQPLGPSCPNPQLLRLPGRCCREWVCGSLDNSIPQDTAATVDRTDRFWQDVPGLSHSVWSNCIEQSTEWSPCSRSCGPGESKRMSNINRACHPQTQIRLCQIRPCHAAKPPIRAHMGTGMCKSRHRSPLPIRLEHHGCYSTHAYRPQFCGLCSDGRCCSPLRTRTMQMGFLCPSGRVIQHLVMRIESCVCHYNCPDSLSAKSRRFISRH
ncbi:WNT1-inducible-signaling pathway protein 2-like [Chanos chanos]|uniref:WNT1-inducible-signaling pathway protein 2-like n=1 Tax=Chanos chanos TaxID=29144 RepID=A0A6J2VQR8_CHACN|nr:WNT1-inducible-signaling pathway protein 2-like [Chanos chanos]